MAEESDLPESHLNERQIRFAREYIIDLNQTQAYIRAGYEDTPSARINASALMTNHNVAALIERLKRDRAKRLEIDADKVLAEISRLAFSDVREIFTGADGLKSVRSLDDDTAAAIQSVKITKKPAGKDDDGQMEYDDVVEYKLADKKGALEMLLKQMGELDDSLNVNLNVAFESPDND